ILLAAFVLLTLTVLSGVFFSEELFGKPFTLTHKNVFAILSWFIFGGLLAGHYFRGWRGRTAVYWTLAGFTALLVASGFFSMSETCMMALNRYRLKHLVREGNTGAKLASALLQRTDELLSFILAGNTVINAATTILVAEICRRLLGTGDYVLAIATFSASFAILIFAEILPKILGATYSETIALGASYLLTPLIRATRPVMWIVNVL